MRKTLKIIKKKVKLEHLYASARAAMAAGIRVGMFIIIGFPHETWRHVWATYKLIARMAWLGAAHVNIGAFSPQPNTALYHELVAEGRIPAEPDLSDEFFYDLFGYLDLTQIRSWSRHFGDRQLTVLRDRRIRRVLFCHLIPASPESALECRGRRVSVQIGRQTR